LTTLKLKYGLSDLEVMRFGWRFQIRGIYNKVSLDCWLSVANSRSGHFFQLAFGVCNGRRDLEIGYLQRINMVFVSGEESLKGRPE